MKHLMAKVDFMKLCIHLFTLYIAFFLIGCSTVDNSYFGNIRKIEGYNNDQEVKQISILTFNIRAGGGIESLGTKPSRVVATEENLLKIVETIKSIDPDIIGLQEVRGAGQARFLANKLNMNFSYAPHRGVTNRNWWGLAILSKFNIESVRSKLINYGYDPRTIQLCIVKINEREYAIFNIHYPPKGNFGNLVKSTIKYVDSVNVPKVLLGDFNIKPFKKEISPIQNVMIDSCEVNNTVNSVKALTRGTWYPSGYNRIDYIFVDSKNFVVKDAGLVSEQYWKSSDHIAYWTTLDLKQ